MRKLPYSNIIRFILIICLLLRANATMASHMYGADFFYTYVSGSTYKISLVMYGDCSGSAFPSFPTGAPVVEIYNGSTMTGTVTLAIQPPDQGVEVTPVCPDQLNNTNCVNPAGTVPGVKKFVYTGNVTLTGTSANWRFRFTGQMGSALAGRSNSITNIIQSSSGSTMVLEATLNNMLAPNVSPVYTTIPTPFFCLNKPANYNPGTVDADGDSLAYQLVKGIDANNGTVTYKSPYNEITPLACAPGTYIFSAITGQLSFTPNLIQRSLVVSKVSEYRNGVLVGTSMREMTFVVIECYNNPPGGKITDVAGGALIRDNEVVACKSSDSLVFDIPATDLDGNVMFLSWAGVPAGANLQVTANSSSSPKCRFWWDVRNVNPGLYSFYITYEDDACPLKSRQTQAYTIYVINCCTSDNPAWLDSVQKMPKANFSNTPKLPAAGENIKFTNESINAEKYHWDFGDNTTSAQKDPEHSYSIRATYRVCLTVENFLGCKDQLCKNVYVDFPPVVGVPNAFSPNGDGFNDILFVKGSSVESMTFRIFNRWGEQVFESHDLLTGWDGNYKGKPLDMDVIAYVLEGTFRNGEVFRKKGNVTILR